MITHAFLNEFQVKDASSLQCIRSLLCQSVPLAGKADLELLVTLLSAGFLQCENFLFLKNWGRCFESIYPVPQNFA